MRRSSYSWTSEHHQTRQQLYLSPTQRRSATHLLLGESLHVSLPPLPRPVRHKSRLHSSFNSARATHLGKQVREPLGRDREQTRVDRLCPRLGRERAERRTVHRCDGEGVRLGEGYEIGRVVAYGDGGDLGEDVQQRITIDIYEVVSGRFGVICRRGRGSASRRRRWR